MAHTVSRKAGVGVLTAQSVKVRRNMRDMRFLYSTLLAVFICMGVVSVYLWGRLATVNVGYEISRANKERDELIEKNKRLRIEYLKLKSPERVATIATRELNMVYPAGGQIVRIR